MKRIISLILLICTCLMSTAFFTSCDEEALRELTNKQWEAAIDSNNFNNVTITAIVVADGDTQTQTIKITETAVYREMSYTYSGQEHTMRVYFEGDDAVIQKNMFLSIFFELVKNKSNFVYDEENDCYTAPTDVTATLYPQGQEANFRDVVLMQNGIVKFDEDYNLSYFSCILTETIYHGDSDTPADQAPPLNTVWNVSAYGSTVISAEEKAAGSSVE